MATISAAVDLGNIWRFPYVVGKNDEATLLVYLAALLLIGLPLALAEAAIGRH